MGSCLLCLCLCFACSPQGALILTSAQALQNNASGADVSTVAKYCKSLDSVDRAGLQPPRVADDIEKVSGADPAADGKAEEPPSYLIRCAREIEACFGSADTGYRSSVEEIKESTEYPAQFTVELEPKHVVVWDGAMPNLTSFAGSVNIGSVLIVPLRLPLHRVHSYSIDLHLQALVNEEAARQQAQALATAKLGVDPDSQWADPAKDWAIVAAQELELASPTSLAVTLELLKKGAALRQDTAMSESFEPHVLCVYIHAPMSISMQTPSTSRRGWSLKDVASLTCFQRWSCGSETRWNTIQGA